MMKLHAFYNKKMAGRWMAAMLSLFLALEPSALPLLRSTVITAEASQWQGKINSDTVNVRSGPSTATGAITTLPGNASVTVLSETRGSDGMTWYQISVDGAGTTGYVRSDFVTKQTVYSASDAGFEQWMNEQGFPESYKNGLRGLHQQYPNWVFKAQHTGLDWNTVIAEESKVGRNLVAKTSKSSWKSIETGAFDWAANSWPGFDGSAWNAASKGIIEHYMDPRNFLTEPYIFQFELQSYNPQTQTREGLLKLVEGTFLQGEALVPVNGSQVGAGTVVEENTNISGMLGAGGFQVGGGAGGNSGTNSSSGSSAVGPGSGFGSGENVGPGIGMNNSSSDSSNVGPGSGMNGSGNGTTDVAGPGAGSQTTSGGGVDFVGPGVASAFSVLSDSLFSLTGGIEAYAGSWQKESDAPLRWVYRNDDGSLKTNGWAWIDGNNDGIAESYYFYPDGAMAYNTVVDGYQVNADGQWVDANGVVQTKQLSGSSAGSVSGSRFSEPMKRVPYVDIIMKAAEVSGVSPYVLASMIMQEQGKGTSDSISGTHSKYPGYYNFYNLGAYAHDGMGAVEAGLQYASESGNGDRPWNNVEKSIIGGAKAYGANYVQNGQDTFYLKKFNVQGTNLYNHQYMTHVLAAASEGAHVSEAYNQNIKATALEFKIPVYQNMPETPCPMPMTDGNPNNKLSGISVDGYQITPTFNMNTTEYSLIVESGTAGININAQTIDSRARVEGAGAVNLNTGLNQLTIKVTAENGSVREYKLNVERRAGAGGMNEPQSGTGQPAAPDASQTAGPGGGSSLPQGSESNVSFDGGNAGGAASGTPSGEVTIIGGPPV